MWSSSSCDILGQVHHKTAAGGLQLCESLRYQVDDTSGTLVGASPRGHEPLGLSGLLVFQRASD